MSTPPDPDFSASKPPFAPTPSTTRAALFALLVLFSMNLLNYVDRYVLAAVGKAIMQDLRLRPGAFGVLGSAFIVVYTVVSPLVGWLGDRYSRRVILAFGVGLWSVATVATAFASTFGQMFLARALLGVGEASYGVVAPALLSDLFSRQSRGRVMGLFYLALPLGTAVGYAVGGLVQSWATTHAGAILSWTASAGLEPLGRSLVGWRASFWVVGVPGLALAAAALMIRDPGRGASEGLLTAGRGPGWKEYLQLLRTPSYLLNTAGMAAVTFTIGAYGHWMPTFFQYVHHTRPRDNLQIGLALAAAGLLGVLLGMWLPDRLSRFTRRAYLLWPALAVLGAIPFGAAGLLAPTRWTALGLLFLASVLLTSCLGPCNTVTANVVVPNRRAVGYALSLFLLHLLGDIPSPPLIGGLASSLARPAVRESSVGRFFEQVGARPVRPEDLARSSRHPGRLRAHGHRPTGPMNLTAGMLVIIPVLGLGAGCFLLGARFLPEDQERASRGG